MNKVKIVFLCFISLGALGYACKKEPVDPKIFVERSLQGIWLIKSKVMITVKNTNDTILKDTLSYLPVDTVAYTADGKYYRHNTLVNFTIDAIGENITYQTPTLDVWHIEFMRNKSVGLTKMTTLNIGTDTFKYYTGEVLFKK